LPGLSELGTPKIRASVLHLGPSLEHGIAEALGDFRMAGYRQVIGSFAFLRKKITPVGAPVVIIGQAAVSRLAAVPSLF
jgi:hypothetical protein